MVSYRKSMSNYIGYNISFDPRKTRRRSHPPFSICALGNLGPGWGVVCEIVANTPSLPLNFSTHIIYIYNNLILQFWTNRVCNVCLGE